jgi:hypothetical protein
MLSDVMFISRCYLLKKNNFMMVAENISIWCCDDLDEWQFKSLVREPTVFFSLHIKNSCFLLILIYYN